MLGAGTLADVRRTKVFRYGCKYAIYFHNVKASINLIMEKYGMLKITFTDQKITEFLKTYFSR